MNRKEFRSLMGEMSNLLESVERTQHILNESYTRGKGLSERIQSLKSKKFTNEESGEMPVKKLVSGLAAPREEGPTDWSDDSSKPRLVPTAKMQASAKKLQGGMVSKQGWGAEPLDASNRSGGKVVSDEPDAEGADESLVDVESVEESYGYSAKAKEKPITVATPAPYETYAESMDKLRKDWKRLIGETSELDSLMKGHSSGAHPSSGIEVLRKPSSGATAFRSTPPPIPKPKSKLQLPSEYSKKFKGLVPELGESELDEAEMPASIAGSLGTSSLPSKMVRSKPVAKPVVTSKTDYSVSSLSPKYSKKAPPIPSEADSSDSVLKRMAASHMSLSKGHLKPKEDPIDVPTQHDDWSDSNVDIMSRLKAKYGVPAFGSKRRSPLE